MKLRDSNPRPKQKPRSFPVIEGDGASEGDPGKPGIFGEAAHAADLVSRSAVAELRCPTFECGEPVGDEPVCRVCGVAFLGEP